MRPSGGETKKPQPFPIRACSLFLIQLEASKQPTYEARFMNPNGTQDVIQQMSVLLNQLVKQLAEKDQTRTLVSVAAAVFAAKLDGSSAALLQEIFEKNFPGQPLPTVLDPAAYEALQKSQEARKP